MFGSRSQRRYNSLEYGHHKRYWKIKNAQQPLDCVLLRITQFCVCISQRLQHMPQKS